MPNPELAKFRKEIRRIFADHLYSEGCSCCRDNELHASTTEALGKLLRAPKYEDGSGYDFSKYRSTQNTKDQEQDK